ncbi:helix-turn-helix transcriptional regulator [Streptomyces sp. MP131-18]|uniref:helix-turn-helix domain-containing protein n=1 Tax=Streptomyces sp. MP131-18 TaxID=1857892 RepID=UPI00097C1633
MTPHGAAIRALREARGLSLGRIADLIGRHRGFLCRIESGQRGASPDTLHRIATALDVPVAAITREMTHELEHPGPADLAHPAGATDRRP